VRDDCLPTTQTPKFEISDLELPSAPPQSQQTPVSDTIQIGLEPRSTKDGFDVPALHGLLAIHVAATAFVLQFVGLQRDCHLKHISHSSQEAVDPIEEDEMDLGSQKKGYSKNDAQKAVERQAFEEEMRRRSLLRPSYRSA